MRKALLAWTLVLFSCSDAGQPSYNGNPSTQTNPETPSGMTSEIEVTPPAPIETKAETKTATKTPDPIPTPAPNPPPAAPVEGFVVDPDTLSFPVVFHMGGSGTWQSEEKLRPVVAEAQRILAQAKIEILPTYTKAQATTDNLDVFFVPQIPNNAGVNGISFANAALEVYVIDNVGLNKVADQRPAEAPVPRYFKAAKPGEKVPVSGEEAEQGRTTAHEISHQLGLPHRQNNTNLLASGTTGWTLNAADIATLRKTAVDKFKAKFVKVLNP